MRCVPALVVMSLLGSAAPASAEAGVFAGGGLRWGEAANAVAMVLHTELDVAPLVKLGVDVYGLCTGGRELALDFGGAALSLLLSPPLPAGMSLDVGLAAGVVPLTVEYHGRQGLPAYLAAEVAVGIELGSLMALRLAFDHTLAPSDPRLALESQLLLMIGLRM